MTALRELLDRLYKEEAARLHGVLIRIFGTHNLELAEDVLHDAFNKALQHWQQNGVPDKPEAWIMRAAKNRAIDALRANKTKTRFSQDLSGLLESEWSLTHTIDHEFSDDHIRDDQLRMIFMCCRPEIKPENRIPFILRTLCGLSIPAIGRALLLPEATVKKRLLRTREKLQAVPFVIPMEDDLGQAMDSVHTVLYLLFNEGFHSSDSQRATHLMFCREAIGLVGLLVEEARLVNRDTLALYALMHFHLARFDARTDADGALVPIDLQNRTLWRHEEIERAQALLNQAWHSPPGASGRFFIEACIAMEHCRATDFAATDWPTIVRLYEALVALTQSPLARLNHAIALAHTGAVEDAIDEVRQLQKLKTLEKSYMTYATLAYLYAKYGDRELAMKNADTAGKLGATEHEKRVLMQQVGRLLDEPSRK